MEDGTYGIDATFTGVTGFERAQEHERVLRSAAASANLAPWWRFLQEIDGRWTLRFGPVSGPDVAAVMESFIV